MTKSGSVMVRTCSRTRKRHTAFLEEVRRVMDVSSYANGWEPVNRLSRAPAVLSAG